MAADQTIFGRLANHLRALEERLLRLQTEVFTSPPPTMEEFNRRRGMWEEVSNEIADLKKVIRGGEEDQE